MFIAVENIHGNESCECVEKLGCDPENVIIDLAYSYKWCCNLNHT
jgi:hypothetical protein